MALQDTPSLVIQVDQASSFPDPTTVAHRQHQVFNQGAAAVALSSIGATPFLIGGVPSSSVNLPAGGVIVMQSDGTKWVVTSNPSRAFFAGQATTNGSGDATFTFPAGLFSSPPRVSLALERAAATSPVDYRITALSTTSCTVRAIISNSVTILGIGVLATSTVLSGAVIDLIATSDGGSP